MATDTERREAARRLREFASDYGSGGARSMNSADANERLFGAIGFDCFDRANWSYLGDDSPDITSAYARRLADLIEPSEPKVECVAEIKVDIERLEKLAHDAAVELTGIDRDALLAVAETLEDCAGRGSDLTALGYSCLAKRIREALGVER